MTPSFIDEVLVRRSSWQIQRAVVFALMMRELKTRFGGHWTGVFWMFGQPLAELMMFLWMNTAIRGRIVRDGYDYVVFLLAGGNGLYFLKSLRLTIRIVWRSKKYGRMPGYTLKQ